MMSTSVYINQPQSENNIASIIFGSEYYKEPTESVHTITTKGAFAAVIEQAAIDSLTRRGMPLTSINMAVEIDKQYASNTFSVQESVTKSKDQIEVIVNVDALDELGVYKALVLVQDALRQLGDSYGTITFGVPLSYKKAELPWFNLH